MVYFAAMNPSENEWFVAGRLQKMSNFIWLAPSFALSASEGHSRRGAFTLSLPNVPIYPELVEGPAAPPLFRAKWETSSAYFFARAIFWELRSHIIPQMNRPFSTILADSNLETSGSTQNLASDFGSRQAKRRNEMKPESFPAVPRRFFFSRPC